MSVVDFVASLLRDGEDGEEPGVFVPEAEKAIADHLDFETPEAALADACQHLMIVAFELETEHQSPQAASVITRVLDRKCLHVRLARDRTNGMAAAEESLKKERTEAFSGFTETKEVRRAPMTDAATPKGSLKLSSIHVRKRIH
jgi:hypothetical protein